MAGSPRGQNCPASIPGNRKRNNGESHEAGDYPMGINYIRGVLTERIEGIER